MTAWFPGSLEDDWSEDGGPAREFAHRAAETFPVEELIALIVDSCTSLVFPSQALDTEFVGHLRASVSQNVHSLRAILAGRIDPQQAELDKVLFFPTVQAQLHIPQKSLQRSYRLSFFLQWEHWTQHFREQVSQVGLTSEEGACVLTWLTRVILSYQDYVASLVADIYTRDHELLSRSRSQIRRTLIRNILSGDEGISAADIAMVGYPLDSHHVAILLPDMSEDAAARLAERLRSSSAAHQALVYPLNLSCTVVWLCRFDPWRRQAVDALIEILERVGAAASVSDAETGVEGFRRSLTQAQETQRVRKAWGASYSPPVLIHSDAGLEILLLQNDELARTFVNTELGPLGVPSAEMERLRETLEASFRFGSHVGAAESLQLHEHTVRNRIHKAEELLGHSLQERRTELQVALRLIHLLEGSLNIEPGSTG